MRESGPLLLPNGGIKRKQTKEVSSLVSFAAKLIQSQKTIYIFWLFYSTIMCSYMISHKPENNHLDRIQGLVQATGAFNWSMSSSSTTMRDSCAPPSAYQRRKALLCGVSYRFKPYELEGTINDVNCMNFFLVRRLSFPRDSIKILTEDERDPSLIPTKQNIRDALQWLIEDCQQGDSLVFYFSGHGSQQPSILNDERDGYDETICPLDYETRGMITDNEINATIVRPLPTGATLHAIIDACHSGTILDLPFLCKINFVGGCKWKDDSPPLGLYKGTSGGLALSFSACDDYQSSADTSAFSASGTMSGAMTYSFLRAADRANGLMTYGELLNAMRSSIREALGKGYFRGPFSSLFNKVLWKGLSQEPQLSSSKKFDVNKKLFVL